MKRIKLLFTFLVFAFVAKATVYYVSPSGNGSTGLTWANAFQTIQPALAAATVGDEIWVAQGAYEIQSEETQLVMKDGVNVYGGYTFNFISTAIDKFESFQSDVIRVNGDNFAIHISIDYRSVDSY